MLSPLLHINYLLIFPHPQSQVIQQKSKSKPSTPRRGSATSSSRSDSLSSSLAHRKLPPLPPPSSLPATNTTAGHQHHGQNGRDKGRWQRHRQEDDYDSVG
ncbi:hypothetical protein Droror1_Dr00025412 [Drosera rotundifolia]